MDSPANPSDDPGDARTLAALAGELADAIDATVAGWAARCVTARWEQWQGAPAPDDVRAAAGSAGAEVRAAVVPPMRELLRTDVDQQRTNPLSVLRDGVGPVTAALRRLGVPPVARDEQAVRLFPSDAYDVGPAAFADLDPAVHDAGLAWGAAKAHVVLRRRRREGRT